MSDSQARPAILIVSHVVPYPPAAGNEIRILKMIEWLRSEGFALVLLLNHPPLPEERIAALKRYVDQVHFIGEEMGELPALPPAPPLAVLKEKLVRELPNSRLYRLCFGMSKEKKIRSDQVKRYLASERLRQATRHLAERYRPAAVLVEYVFAAPCLDAVGGESLKIIDTHDMFSRKKEQVLAFGIDDPLPCSRAEERGYLLRADLVIAIQTNEGGMFSGLVPERDVVTTGIDFEVVADIDNSAEQRGTVLVVGSDNPLNVHGLRHFHEHCWPRIRQSHPGAVLRVVGKLANHLETGDAQVHCVGWVADLDEEYRRAAVVINPTLAGTGLKIKSVEALCRGKALVGTPNSVEGIDFDGEPPFMVGENAEEFAAHVSALLNSDQQRLQLQKAAWRYALENFSTETVYRPLGRKLRPLLRARH